MLLRRYYRIDATSADITSPLFTPLPMPPMPFHAMFILFHLFLADFIFIIVVLRRLPPFSPFHHRLPDRRFSCLSPPLIACFIRLRDGEQ
jgi:hypothetical protein